MMRASWMSLLVSPKFGDGRWSDILFRNITFVSVTFYFTAFLCSVVFVGQATLRLRFDFEEHRPVLGAGF
jgi:hypothetical protein